ncbi:GTPase HflX [archaeon HR01]|nr:GTPase HflX [archaeon HR01]
MKVAAVQRVSRREELYLEELLELCEAAGYESAYTITQVRPPHPKYNIGPGKLEELRNAVKTMGLSKVVFGGDVKPVQEYNLAKSLGVPVISRTQLILEIFNRRASSSEAKLQIRLAELRYELSRAKEKVRLAKKGEQPGFHGLGAYEAEVYYDEVKRQMHTIYQKLSAIKRRNSLVRAKRVEEGIPLVALTGYTNAGKSTLFNLLAGESRPVSPQMFTTLSTTTRLTTFDGRKAYISDTVGFIRNLPPLLIDAFNSTLSEFIYADLILLVVDVSEDVRNIQEKINTCIATLREVGVVDVPILIVFNKADLCKNAAEYKIASLEFEQPYVVISALTGYNISQLCKMAGSMMGGYVRIRAVLENGGDSYELLSRLKEHGSLISLNYGSGGIEFEADATVEMAEKIRRSASVFQVVG